MKSLIRDYELELETQSRRLQYLLRVCQVSRCILISANELSLFIIVERRYIFNSVTWLLLRFHMWLLQAMTTSVKIFVVTGP